MTDEDAINRAIDAQIRKTIMEGKSYDFAIRKELFKALNLSMHLYSQGDIFAQITCKYEKFDEDKCRIIFTYGSTSYAVCADYKKLSSYGDPVFLFEKWISEYLQNIPSVILAGNTKGNNEYNKDVLDMKIIISEVYYRSMESKIDQEIDDIEKK